jgi:succinate dehydrogenase/fumarate reductase flavoprotein subunit
MYRTVPEGEDFVMADYDVVVVACGEMVGGLFHGNYPGGTGLMAGAVFGRIAGASASGA